MCIMSDYVTIMSHYVIDYVNDYVSLTTNYVNYYVQLCQIISIIIWKPDQSFYLVYTWYIPGIYHFEVYTWYIPGISRYIPGILK